MKSGEKSFTGCYFLLIVIIVYLAAGVFRPDALLPSLQFSLKIAVNIAPVFVIVLAIMAAFNYFVNPAGVKKYLGESSGCKRWIIAVIGGIVSTGPIYMWYPMLKELKKKGVNYGFIATFLYNRAVKLPLLPMMIFYFGLNYTVMLTIVMILASIVQGILIEKIEGGGFL